MKIPRLVQSLVLSQRTKWNRRRAESYEAGGWDQSGWHRLGLKGLRRVLSDWPSEPSAFSWGGRV